MADKHAHGRCFCGRVEYRIELPTEFVMHCYSRSCQLSHGSVFVTRLLLQNSVHHLV